TTGLENAAKDAVDLAGAGGYGQGVGEENKGSSDSSTKNSSSRGAREKTADEKLADKLAENEAMERLKQKLAWETFKKYEIPKQLLTSFMDNVIKKGLIEPIGKMVTGKTSSALGLGSSAPPDYGCYTCSKWAGAVDASKCIEWNMIYGPSNDSKTIDSWKNRGCVIQRAGSADTSSGGNDDPGGSGTNTADGGSIGNQLDAITPDANNNPDLKLNLEGYDTTLRQLFQDVQDGKESSKPEKVVEKSKSVINAFTGGNALPIENITQAIRTSAIAFRNGDLNEYEKITINSRTELSAIKTRYGTVNANLDKVISGETKVTKTVKTGGLSSQVDQNKFIARAEYWKKIIESDEPKFEVAEKKIAYAEESHGLYKGQTETIESLANEICGPGQGECSEVRQTVQQVAPTIEIATEADYETKRNEIIKGFKDLTGFDCKVKPATTENAALQGNTVLLAMAGDFRDGAGEETVAPFAKAFEWRGVDKVESAFKTEETAKAEKEAWKSISPAMKEKRGELPEVTDESKPAKNFTSMNLRLKLIATDLSYIKMEPTAAASLLSPMTAGMDAAKKEFAKWDINLDGNNTSSPVVDPVDGGGGNGGNGGDGGGGTEGDSALETLRNSVAGDISGSLTDVNAGVNLGTGEIHTAKTATFDSGVPKCNSGTCRTALGVDGKGNELDPPVGSIASYNKMKEAQSNIVALEDKLAAAKTSAEIAQIKTDLGTYNQDFKDAQGEYNTHMDLVKKRMGMMPTPIQEPVLPNNGGNNDGVNDTANDPIGGDDDGSPLTGTFADKLTSLSNIAVMESNLIIDAYDENNQPIPDKTKPIHYKRVTHLFGYDTWEADRWRTKTIKLRKFYLEYNGSGHKPPITFLSTSEGGTIGIYTGQYAPTGVKNLDIDIRCRKNGGKFSILSAELKLDQGTSSDNFGGGITVSGKVGIPLVVERGVADNVNYSHTLNHYNGGEMIEQKQLHGRECKP
ncbi:MAG: hypothetical protein KKD35_08330, partial [Elusimicrobia bacterium]|nr:hypothetical protein [Elusimicrobiota bacterium]